MTGRFALGAEGPVDVFGLLLAVDAFAPPVFDLDLPTAWVPTVELTAHIRGVPAPGPAADPSGISAPFSVCR